MQRFVPKQKLSKKAKRAIDGERRVTWGTLRPVTRVRPDGKAYERKKGKAIELEE